jgi:hypothetical protein
LRRRIIKPGGIIVKLRRGLPESLRRVKEGRLKNREVLATKLHEHARKGKGANEKPRQFSKWGGKVKLYLCHKFTAQSLKETGIRFGIKESGVSHASRRLEKNMKQYASLWKSIHATTAQ